MYVDQGLSCPEIGRAFDRDGSTVRGWLAAAGVETRPRGSNAAVHFKPGQRSAFAGRTHSEEAKARIGASSVGRAWARGDEHWLRRVEPQQNPNWKGGATPERQEFYRSPEWKAACVAVWARSDARCERCELDWRTVNRRTTPSFHVHHIVGFAVKELRADTTNLALLCRPCHLFVHSKANTMYEFLASPLAAGCLRDLVSAPSLFDLDAMDAENGVTEAA